MIVKLKDVCTKIGSGATPKGGKNAYKERGISLIRSQNVLDYEFSHEGLAYIDEVQAARLNSVTIKPDDVLLNITGDSVARVCIVDNSILPARINQHVCIVRADKDKILSSYILYFLQMKKFELLALASSGATRNALTKGMIENLEVDLPSLNEQKKIVSLLDFIDNKIRCNVRINKNLEQQMQALYKAWFVDFIHFNGAKPDNWTISSLGEVTNMGAGGDKPKIISAIQTEECPYPIYSNGLSDNGLYGYTNTPKIYDESVTVSARGTIGFVCIRHTPYVPIVRLVTLIPNTEIISAKYLYLYLKQLNITGTGTTQQQLTVPDFRKTEILVPDKETMSAFTDIITPLFSKIWANEKENASLSTTRDTLLPKLMSGELDVSEVNF